jgi:hypothetical protein
VTRLQRILRDNGLSICLLTIFLIALIGQALAGHRQFNENQQDHGLPSISLARYLTSGEFIEATFENWESEFLQMALYVWLTSFLYQRGSAESKDPDKKEEGDEDPRLHRADPQAPLPVRRGGLMLFLYERSLSLSLVALFLVSFWLHLVGNTREHCREQIVHGQPCSTMLDQATSAKFWFESLQNWQSEFLAVFAIVTLSVFLRQRGSPESKPVAASNSATGSG